MTTAVKLERNKLTTVKGKPLTRGVDIDITIEDEFAHGIEFEVPIDVATVAALNENLTSAICEQIVFKKDRVLKIYGTLSYIHRNCSCRWLW